MNDIAIEAIDRAIKRMQNLPDYAGRPSWDKIVAEELNNVIAQKDSEIERLREDVSVLEIYKKEMTEVIVDRNAEIERLRQALAAVKECIDDKSYIDAEMIIDNALRQKDCE